MRVIAGEAKGRRLAPVPEGTRPVSDRAREGLFSSLGQRVVGARCLDLYAGTGALGIEALSRGAEACVFVEDGAAAVRTIRENLSRTGLEDRGEVVRAKAAAYLAGGPGSFDLVFLDPPYATAEGDVRDILDETVPHLLTGATLVLTRPKGASTDVIPVNLQVGKHLEYGDTHVLVLGGP